MNPSMTIGILIALIIRNVIGTSLPNIIFILTDDMGNADASFNFKLTNPSKASTIPIITPNIDFLAERGIILSQHYSHHVCGPSRCALITSRLSHNLGNPFPTRNAGNLKSGYKTFIHELSDRGYRNHFIGKWGIDYDNRTYSRIQQKWNPKPRTKNESNVGPFGRGFDTFYGMYSSGHNHFTKKILGILDWHLFNETHLLDAPYGLDQEVDKSSTTLITRHAVQLINKHDTDNPFFMHISYSMPHDPLQVEERFLDKRNFAFCHNSPSWRRRVYCGMIACIDEGIGNITKTLKENKMLSNTVIIFASDNGGFMNVGGYNYPFRGVKSTSFEGGIRTLSFVYGMYADQKGKIFDGIFHLVDWGPTILSYIDSTQNKAFKHQMGTDIDGIDLSETLKEFGNKINGKQLIYRNNLIAQSEPFNLNVTTYIEGDYKLMLGRFQFGDIFYEPNDTWSVAGETRKWHYILMDVANYVIENTIGSPNWFFLEWAFAFRLMSIYNGEITGFPQKNQNTFIIPKLDWNEKDAKYKIKLFNLKTDETESKNIAFENKEKVEEMYKNMKIELNKTIEIVDDDLFAYIANMFNTFSMIVFGFFIAIPIIGFLILFCVLKCLFCPKTKRKKKKND